jgi:hypothetical protein
LRHWGHPSYEPAIAKLHLKAVTIVTKP